MTNVSASDLDSPPYSECMSKIRLLAALVLIAPHSSSLVRNDLPVPDLPKTPLERSTKRPRSTQTGMSMSRGMPS